MPKVPTYDQLLNPTIRALHALGGSGTIEEIYSKVTELVPLTEAQLELIHNPERGSQTEVEYRLAWARTYLKKYGILENSSRGVWSLTPKGRQTERVSPEDVKKLVKEQLDAEKITAQSDTAENPDIEYTWRNELLQTLLDMDPAAFERLAQRLLRESGFTQVEVLGKSGDGGIDGKGIMRVGGLLSFHVYFQCKRYKGSVSASQVRDFRGAMIGRADKALLITTGNFTKDAVKEATRDGAAAIDLIDGDALIDMLKDLGLGVATKRVETEHVEIDRAWYMSV